MTTDHQMATMYAAQREVTAALHEIGDVDLACRLERCMTARRGGELWPAVQGIGALARLDLDKLPDHLATLGGCEAGDRRQKRCFTIGRAGLGNVIDLLTAKQGQGVGLVIKAFLTLCLATALGGLGITARAANDPPNRTIDPNSPMTFEYTGTGGNIKGADWIAAEGIISADTPDTFRRFLQSSGVRNTTVQFNSLGGNLIAALKLGELIRQAHLDTSIGRTVFNENGSIGSTTVDGVCVSACAYAFIGGEGRLVGGNGKYGVHQFYDAKAVDEPAKKAFSAIDVSVEKVLAGLVLDYVLRMGVDAKLISLAEATSPWDMRYLTAKELSSFRIDNTGSIDTGWRIDARDGGAVLETRSSYSIRPAVTVTLLCRGAKTSTNLIIASSTKYLDRWLTEGYGWPRPPNVQQIRAELHGLSISGPRWQSHLSAATIGSVEIDSERRIRVSVNLPPDVLKNLSAGGHIVISFDFPDEYASFLYADIASSLPPQVIELVLRNCTH